MFIRTAARSLETPGSFASDLQSAEQFLHSSAVSMNPPHPNAGSLADGSRCGDGDEAYAQSCAGHVTK
jgi:hypothetical protein